MASMTGLVFLACFAFYGSLAGRLLADPDTLIHVAVGRSIAAHHAVPWTDTFSHTFAGAPWIAKEWLSQILFAGADALAGWAGVALLAAAAAATAMAMVYAFLARRVAPIRALAVTSVVAALCAPHALARPHLLALPLLILWTRGLIEAVETRTPPRWTLVPVMAAWANLHASFAIGFVLAGVLALDAFRTTPAMRRRGLALAWLGVLGTALAASFVTPYGGRALLVTLNLFGSGEPMPYINEWQPLAFDGIGCLAMALMASVLAALLCRPRDNVVRIALVALLAVMALRHSRFLELFALLTPLVAADPILRLVPRLRTSPPSAQGFAARLSVTVAAGLIAVVALLQHPLPDPRNMPSAALAAAQARGLTDGKVYNDVDFGGFLIASGVPTFIDGRSDQIFLGGFTRGLNEAAAATADAPFIRLIEAHAVSWALVRTGSDEARHLDHAAGWTPVYGDGVARVFARSAS